jgi:hypothetical protein
MASKNLRAAPKGGTGPQVPYPRGARYMSFKKHYFGVSQAFSFEMPRGVRDF